MPATPGSSPGRAARPIWLRATAASLLASCVLAIGGCQRAGDAERRGRPNLVWILLDALRAKNLSSYGYERPTSPNLDALAAQGALFERAYSQSYRTRFSVPQYLTGRLFPVPGFIGFWPDTWRKRPTQERYIGEILRDDGYRTALFTAHGMFAGGDRIESSFDEFNPGADRLPTSFEELNALIRRWLDSRGPGPFFLYIHALDTHFPHRLRPPYDRWLVGPPPQSLDLYDSQPENGSFSHADREYLRGLYDGSLAYADDQIGELVEILRSEGELDRTLLVVSADHGEMLGEDGTTVGHHARTKTQEVFNVPLIMAGPGVEAGRRVRSPVGVFDIAPTVVDLLGVRSQAISDGQSLVPLLKGAPVKRDYAYSGSFAEDGSRVHILRDAQAKYLRRESESPGKPKEELWAVPDYEGHRKPFAGDRDAKLTEMRRRLADDILPKLAAYEQLPLVEPQIFVIDLPAAGVAGGISPEAAIVRAPADSQSRMDRWTVSGRFITSCGDGDEVPLVTITLRVPNEHYRVEMQLRALPRRDGGSGAGSALRVQAGGDAAFHDVAFESARAEATRYVVLGEYDVTDGKLAITLRAGDPSFCASAGRLQFTPKELIQATGMTGELLERLRSLGYVE